MTCSHCRVLVLIEVGGRMASVKPLTRAELAGKYNDSAWQRKLLEILSLVGILRECIIENDYRPSEELNAAIVLTDAGTRVSTQLITQEKVNAKDARVLAFLGLVHIEPLVDVDRTDLSKPVDRCHLQGDLGWQDTPPLTLGRDLYDRAAALFPEEREYLNYEDTLKLLESTEEGVFQSGYYLIGPWGIRRRDYFRRMGPVTAVPLQHCADTACGAVHRVQLTTSWEAGVNRSRPLLTKTLDKISDEPSEWNGFISDITEDDFNAYDVSQTSTLPYLIGDAFSTGELQRLAVHAVLTSKGALHAAAASLAFRDLRLSSPKHSRELSLFNSC